MSEQVKRRRTRDQEHGRENGAGGERRAQDDDRGLSVGGRSVLTASPLIWVLLAGALGWAIWATVTRGSSSSSSAPARAVLVPTAGGDRMVVAMPCGGGSASAHSASGGTSVVLPAHSGERVVLVPGCSGGSGSSGASGGSGSSGGSGASGSSGGSGSGGPVAVRVLAPGSPAPKHGNAFKVPSTARTIIVTPCQGKQSGSSQGSSPRALSSGRGVLVAPPCSG